ncbi:MAG: bi-domain-containing oxidoreductase [Chloroflexi bacterium]|nr:bi-domain-containing oxidoreductase [Chloroflexota bacterium]
MKQVVLEYSGGGVKIVDVPLPAMEGEGVLVRTAFSVISPGTERASVEMARRSLLDKARSRPDLVRKAWQSVKTHGLMETYRLARDRLDAYTPLGYSSAGVVLESSCQDYVPGDRVACGGVGYASHAEVVYVPKNLAARIPEGVALEDAAFATLGAIALQGIRQAGVSLGERVLVIGLGLVGQLTVQLLKAQGCLAFGVDLSKEAAALALRCGANGAVAREALAPEDTVQRFTNGVGFDAAIITASTSSNDPVEVASQLLRDRGRLVVVGAVKADLHREPFYSKELEVRFSRSYGPGRYDPVYEEKGIDYPVGYVRWTEKRNMEGFLDMLKGGMVRPGGLVTHRLPIQEAEAAYRTIAGIEGGNTVGVIFEYPQETPGPAAGPVVLRTEAIPPVKATANVGIALIGAGNFAKGFLLPPLKRSSTELVVVVNSSGPSARKVAERFGFRMCSTDPNEALAQDNVHAAVIATPHHLHARQAALALKRGKHVFVEKPLALTEGELQEVMETALASGQYLAVGFNRRFSPMIALLREFLKEKGAHPLVMSYRVNAGPLPPGHWAHDPDIGGGRILGEVCHFVDTLYFLCGHPLQEIRASALPVIGDTHPPDNLVATLSFADGSLGTIVYTSRGSPALPKERLEVFGGGCSAVVEDFRLLELFQGHRRVRRWSTGSQQKGYKEEVESFLDVVRGKRPPAFSLEELAAVTRATMAIQEAVRKGRPVTL